MPIATFGVQKQNNKRAHTHTHTQTNNNNNNQKTKMNKTKTNRQNKTSSKVRGGRVLCNWLVQKTYVKQNN